MIVKGQKMAEIRSREYNLTQQQVADIINCSVSNIKAIENNYQNPSCKIALRLCSLYDYPVYELFDIEEEIENTIYCKLEIQTRNKNLKK